MEISEHSYQYDVFVSYASEDREPFVRTLAEDLRDHGIRVWYDQFSLEVGDSLSEKINEGLRYSRFGLIVVSPQFLKKKNWTQKELNTLLSLQVAGRSRVLPVLHTLTFDQLQQDNPLLADLLALDSSRGSASIVSAIARQILKDRDSRSPLIESYQAVFSVRESEYPDHVEQVIQVNGIFTVPKGEELVYRDIVTTSSPMGRLNYFHALPQPSVGLEEQFQRSQGKFMHFELKGPPGETTMQVSALLSLTKKMTADDGYVALRLPYATRFFSVVFDYSGLNFKPEEFVGHVDVQSSEAKETTPTPLEVVDWGERSVMIARGFGYAGGTNPMVGWGKWADEWNG